MNKEKIIQKSETYSEIINEKKANKSKYFSIYYKKTDKNNKYGITVPKKVGKANIRNKLKRQIKGSNNYYKSIGFSLGASNLNVTGTI